MRAPPLWQAAIETMIVAAENRGFPAAGLKKLVKTSQTKNFLYRL
jgi:hypothetical protein